MTYSLTAPRKQYPKEVKREIAQLVISGRAQIRELSAKRKIPEGNIARWVKQARKNGNGNGAHKEVEAPADAKEPGTALTVLKRPSRGGRYTNEQKLQIVEVIKSGKLPLSEIAARTKVHPSTLYAWSKAALQDAGDRAVQVEVMQQENRRNTMQAVLHLRKAKAELIGGIRRGDIDDFDNVHLNCLLALNALNVK